jgi:uncharacterized protein with ATP-grasp and redox domains
MPLPFFLLLGGFLGGVVFTTYCVAFLEEISSIVTEWLRRSNLDQSWLMRTVIFLTNVGAGIRRVIVGESKNSTSHIVEDKTMTREQIDDPEVRAMLEKEGKCILQLDNRG